MGMISRKVKIVLEGLEVNKKAGFTNQYRNWSHDRWARG